MKDKKPFIAVYINTLPDVIDRDGEPASWGYMIEVSEKTGCFFYDGKKGCPPQVFDDNIKKIKLYDISTKEGREEYEKIQSTNKQDN